jgi:NAD-dependent deacetylase
MNPLAAETAIRHAADLIRNARHAVAFTGAGISTPSGIPDFRSSRTGLWKHSDPMKVASLTSFRHSPQVFFDWLRPLARQILLSEPNPAHLALAKMETAGFLKAIITQNIDGLHQRAGSRTVLEVHGSMNTLSCQNCRQTFPSQLFSESFINEGTIPHCPHCQSTLKPDIVLYEEMLPAVTWQMAANHSQQADVFLVAGSSLEVMPAAGLPYSAVENKASLIINNLSPTYLDDSASVLLPLDVAEALPAMIRYLV